MSAGNPARAPRTVDVCAVEDIPEGGRYLTEVNGRRVGVFCVHGRYYAVQDRCPHMAAPLALGRASGIMRASADQELTYDDSVAIIACPWHHWEFDLGDGRCVTDPNVRTRVYRTIVEGGRVLISL